MHKHYLLQALAIADRYRGYCSPNPSVGALIVHDNRIIVQAGHEGIGKPHAEVNAIEGVKALCQQGEFSLIQLKQSIMYVTLEPCNHWGYTPPCVNAIRDSGIKKVVFAYYDPNPIVKDNNSSELLKLHGLYVEHFAVDEINQFYRSYTHWITTEKPFVTIKLAMSLDNKIAGKDSQSMAISGSEANNFTHRQRLCSDMLLTSSQTVNNDDPLLNARTDQITVKKKVVVIDRALRMNTKSRLYDSSQQLIIFYDKKIKPPAELETVKFYGVDCNAEGLDLAQIINKLGEMGCHDLWVEVGSQLFHQMHKYGLVDKTYLYINPKVIGHDGKQADFIRLFDRKFSINWSQLGDDALAEINWEKG